MKSKIRLLPTTLASLVLLGSGLGIDAAHAQFSNRRPRSFPEAAERWGYECKRERSGYFCKGDDDRFDDDERFDDRRDRRSDRFRFNKGRLYEGKTIRTSTKNRDRIVMRKDDNRDLTLYIEDDILADDTGRVIIPRNSRIEGRLRSRDGGIQYDARRIVLPNGRRYNLDAFSEVIYPNRQVASRRTRTSEGVRDVLATILGDRRRRDDDFDRRNDDFDTRDRNLVVIYPERDLDLRLKKDLKID
ncbi:TrbI/VirB10 family protein [Acaryochloris sp. CCMEE 5410]|uniref:TrbI/VirB10 family protein n=1 Tax=Acaryochloris sp. CCMEE 5410 TaxID=310037 RepID=UPI0002484354|nr:TrbI/VirB10 family protein [Acaryochloris sp. CCMEE 5410]KAI9133983.1 TrbI/VirB10 family protein [Acaryochloris sp. CCMEE 5410]